MFLHFVALQVLVLLLLGGGLYESIAYYKSLSAAVRDPDPFSSDPLLHATASSAPTAASDADPQGMLSTTEFLRGRFQPQQFLPSLTIPMLVVIRPRTTCCGVDRADLGSTFLSAFNVTVWWAEFLVCVSANNVSAITRSPIGDPTMTEHFPKLVSGDNKTVNAFLWLANPSSSSSSSSPGKSTSTDSNNNNEDINNNNDKSSSFPTEEFSEHKRLRTVVGSCLAFVAQPEAVAAVDVVHVHSALAETRPSLVVRWPIGIVLAMVVVLILVSFPMARTVVSAETKTTLISLLRTRVNDTNNAGGAGGNPVMLEPYDDDEGGDKRNSNNSNSNSNRRKRDRWTDSLILEVACGRVTAQTAIRSLMQQWAVPGEAAAAISSSSPAGGGDYSHASPVNGAAAMVVDSSSPSPSPAPAPPPQPPLVDLAPAPARQLFVHVVVFLWLLCAAGVLPFCIVCGATRLTFAIRGTAHDRSELGSPFFLPTLLLTAFLPLCALHVALCARVVDAMYVRDVHADFATFLKQELLWARLWFTPDGWWLAASAPATDDNDDASSNRDRRRQGGARSSPGAGGGGWSLFGLFGGGGYNSPSLLSPQDDDDDFAASTSGGSSSARRSIPARFQQHGGNAANRGDDDDQDSVGEGLLPRQQQRSRQQQQQGYGTINPAAAEDEDDDDEDDEEDEDEDKALTCGEKCCVAGAPVIASVALPLLVALRTWLHCPIISAEKAARRFMSPIIIAFFLVLCVVGSVLLAEGAFALVGAITITCAASIIVSVVLLLPLASAAALGSIAASTSWFSEALGDPACAPTRQARSRFEHSAVIHATFCAFQRELGKSSKEQEQQQQQNNSSSTSSLSCCCYSFRDSLLVKSIVFLTENRGNKRRLRALRWAILFFLVLVPFCLAVWFFVDLHVDSCGWEHFLPSSRRELRQALVLRDDGGRGGGSTLSSVMMPFVSLFAGLSKSSLWEEPFFAGMARSHFTVSQQLLLSAQNSNCSSNSGGGGSSNIVNTLMWDVSRNNVKDITITAIEGLIDNLDPFNVAYQNLVKWTCNADNSAALSIVVPPFDPFGSVAAAAAESCAGCGDHAAFVRLVNAGLVSAGGLQMTSSLALTTLPKGTTFVTGTAGATTRALVDLARMRAVIAFYWPILAGTVAFMMFALWSRVDFRIVAVLRHRALRKRLQRETRRGGGVGGSGGGDGRRQKGKQQQNDENAQDEDDDDDATTNGGGGSSSDQNTSASSLAIPDDYADDVSDASDGDISQRASLQGRLAQRDATAAVRGSRQRRRSNSSSSGEDDGKSKEKETAAGQAFMARVKTTTLVVFCLFFNAAIATSAGVAAATLHASLFTPGCDCGSNKSARLSVDLLRTAFFPGISLLLFLLECVDFWSYIMLPFQSRPMDVEKLLQLVSQHARARNDANNSSNRLLLSGGNSPRGSGFMGGYQQYLHYVQESQHRVSAGSSSPNDGSGNNSSNNNNDSFASSASHGGAAAASTSAGGGGAGSVAGRSAAVEACGTNSLRWFGFSAAAGLVAASLLAIIVGQEDVPIVTQFYIALATAAGWKLIFNLLVHPAQRNWCLSLKLFV